MANRLLLIAVALTVFVTQGAGYAQDTVRSAGESLTATKTAAQAQGPPLPQPESITVEFMGHPATGKPVRFLAIDVLRIRGGQIVEDWHLEDNLTFLQQLGVVAK